MNRIDAIHLLKAGPLTDYEVRFLHYFERSKEHKLTDFSQFRKLVSKYFPNSNAEHPPLPLPEDHPF